MMLKKRYDLVFSIGDTCGCAMNLQRFGLRTMSSPLDWTGEASFENRIDMLCGGFAEFMKRENLEIFVGRPEENLPVDHASVRDRVYGYYFVHDFERDRPLEESFPPVREKYDRRVARLLRTIRASKTVLAVWWSKNKLTDDETCRTAVARLRDAFPGVAVDLLVCENDCKRADVVWSAPGPDVTRAVGPICPDPGIPAGDPAVCEKIFSHIRLTAANRKDWFREHLIVGLANALGMWHLDRKARKEARERYQAKFARLLG